MPELTIYIVAQGCVGLFEREVPVMDMSIAAMSVSMHQNQAMQDMGMAVLKMAMDTTEVATEEMLAELSVDPNLGTMVDIQA